LTALSGLSIWKPVQFQELTMLFGGALGLLTGCDLTDNEPVQRVLWNMSFWNDRAQSWLFNPNRLAPTYPESAVDRAFRYNAFYPEEQAPALDPATYKLELSGLVENKRPWNLDQLYQLPQTKYVGFICADGYYTSIDMPTALHSQTIMAFTFADQVLPRKFGYPMKIRIPTKLGFKNPKFVVALSVTNNYPGGFWEDYGYNWFSGS
jgi:DMSO/TMAO reductase YedYZ molybdopterin-dependent catalytic subunit